MEGTVEKDTTSPIKETKTSPVKESKTAEVEPCVHNGTNEESKTKTPEKVAQETTPAKKTPEQGTKRKIEDESTGDDEIKKVKVIEKAGEGDELSPKKDSTLSDEALLLKTGKKLDEDEDVVSESGAAQEAC